MAIQSPVVIDFAPKRHCKLPAPLSPSSQHPVQRNESNIDTSPHGSDFGDHPQILGLATGRKARRGTATAHRVPCWHIPREGLKGAATRSSATRNVHEKRNCPGERGLESPIPSAEKNPKFQVLQLVSPRNQKAVLSLPRLYRRCTREYLKMLDEGGDYKNGQGEIPHVKQCTTMQVV